MGGYWQHSIKKRLQQFLLRLGSSILILLVFIVPLSACTGTPDELETDNPTSTPIPEPEWSFTPLERNSYSIVDMVSDDQGFLWTTGEGGVAQWDLNDGSVEYFGHDDGMPGYAGKEIIADAIGGIWINWEHPTYKGYGVSRYYEGNWEHFNEENGLVDNIVANMSADTTGRVWFATTQGVSSFDSSIWRNFTTLDGLPSDSVNIIYAAPDESIWVQTDNGVAAHDGEKWVVDENLKLASVNVNDIFQAQDGNIWFATSSLICRYDGEQPAWFRSGEVYGQGLEGAKSFFSFAQTNDGVLWVNGAQGLYARKNDNWYSFLEDAGLPFFSAEGLFTTKNGDLWAISHNDGLFRISDWSLRQTGVGVIAAEIVCKGNVGTVVSGQFSVSDMEDYSCLDEEVYIDEVIELNDGRIVLASTEKITVMDPEFEYVEFAIPKEISPKETDPTFSSDPELYGKDQSLEKIGRSLYQYDGTDWQDLSAENQLFENVTQIKTAPDGRVWIGSKYAISVWDGIEWVHWSQDKGDNNLETLDVKDIVFQDGDIWISDKPRGISRLPDGNLKEPDWEIISLPDWDRKNNALGITQMIFDSKGGLWVEGMYGMPAYYDGVEWQIFPQDQYKKISVSRMVLAPNGDLWLGFRDNLGIDFDKIETQYEYFFKRYDGTEWHDIGAGENLPNGIITRIIFNDDGDAWVAFYDHGIVRYNSSGNFLDAFNTSNIFNDSDRVKSIYFDETGALIVNLEDGVARYGIPLD